MLALTVTVYSPTLAWQNPSPIAPMPATPAASTPAVTPWAEGITRQVIEEFKTEKLLAGDFAFTLLDLSDPQAPFEANYRSQEPIYPASVVKLFYLAAAQAQLDSGEMPDTPELRRAMRDMIVDSTNDATALVLDMLTQTTGGPELSPAEFEVWAAKRNGVNRFFAGLGYTGLNVNQKPWNEGPYGREKQFVGTPATNRNKLTTAATARLMAQIAAKKWVSSARSEQMLELLKRNPTEKDSGESQVVGFIGSAISNVPGAAQWSKAGWTSATRHDAAYVELPVSARFPRGARFVLVVFTENHANQAHILPAIARRIIEKQFGASAMR